MARPKPPTKKLTKRQRAFVEANMGLVYTAAQRFRHPAVLFEDRVGMFSIVLCRCSQNFDESRGYTFSTYFNRACLYQIARENRNPTPIGDDIEDWRVPVTRDDRTNEAVDEAMKLLSTLTPNWRTVLMGRAEGLTLAQVGAKIGVGKERARQIERAALARVRATARAAG